VRLRGCRGSTGRSGRSGAGGLTRDEVRALLSQLEGTKWLMASLLYALAPPPRVFEAARKGRGLRLRQIVVRDGKGGRIV